MNALCTHCSAKKRHDPSDMPAILRYKSQRICDVHTAALSLKAGFFILSGKFGLLRPCYPIPDYDHKLTDPEVEAHSKTVAAQLAESAVDHLVYITQAVADDQNLKPYLETIRRACALTSVSLFVLQLPGEE